MTMAAPDDTQGPRSAVPPRSVEDRVVRMAGEPVKADPLVPLSTRVPESLRKRVRMASLEDDLDVQAFVAAALEEKLARRGRG